MYSVFMYFTEPPETNIINHLQPASTTLNQLKQHPVRSITTKKPQSAPVNINHPQLLTPDSDL